MLALLIGAALIIRSVLAARSGLWRDEGLFLFVTRSGSLDDVLKFLQLHESHPPLFYFLMRGWLAVTTGTDTAALFLPVLVGVVLVPVIYGVGSSLFSRRVGLLAATLAAFSPRLAEYSAVVRPYSLLPLLAMLSAYTLIKGIETTRNSQWAAYSMSTLLMLYTHNWSWLFLAGEWASVGVVFVRRRTGGRRNLARKWFVSQMLIFLGYLVWVPTFIYQVRNTGQAPSPWSLTDEPVQTIGIAARQLVESTIVGYTPEHASYATTVMGTAARLFFVLPLILFAVDQFLRVRTRQVPTSIRERTDANAPDSTSLGTSLTILLGVPATAWLAALTFSSRSDLMIPRCLVTLAPLLVLALACWLAQRRTGARRVVIDLALLLLLSSYMVSLSELGRLPKSNARELAAMVTSQTRPSDLMVIAPAWLASSFNLYYRAPIEQVDYPQQGKQGRIDFANVRARLSNAAAYERTRQNIACARAAQRRVWLIVNGDDLFDTSTAVMNALLRSPNWYFVGVGRVAQIRLQLDSLYGPPDRNAVPTTSTSEYENLRAFLYELHPSE